MVLRLLKKPFVAMFHLTKPRVGYGNRGRPSRSAAFAYVFASVTKLCSSVVENRPRISTLRTYLDISSSSERAGVVGHTCFRYYVEHLWAFKLVGVVRQAGKQIVCISP
jgi:hypothetical protein